MTAYQQPSVALGPAGAPEWIAAAIEAGGGVIAPLEDASALVWTDPRDATGLAGVLQGRNDIDWVQLPWAGVEHFADYGLFDDGRVWTCGKGVYAEEVAEHALGLALAGLRRLPDRVRATSWAPPSGLSLLGQKVVVLGGGGITEALLRLLGPFGVDATVVRRQPTPVRGATSTVGADRLHDVLPGAAVVFLALALTPETTGVISADELSLLGSNTWLVNVARGAHVVTDDLVAALRAGAIGGAALDVTDPEPLPEGHPLWSLPNVIITPHCANTPDMARGPLAARITANVQRYGRGEPLMGGVDPQAGY
ncbi:MAG: D-isomer specific 2-hydroxyacid dehydrogenase family protein [Acidimicrobiales bacterium]